MSSAIVWAAALLALGEVLSSISTGSVDRGLMLFLAVFAMGVWRP